VGDISFDPAWSRETVIVYERDGTKLIVRAAKHAPGFALDAIVDRLLEEARRMKDFALVERVRLEVDGRPARRARIRSKTDEGVLAQTVVFIDAPGDELVTFACATTRESEETRESVNAAQASILSSVLATVRFSGPVHGIL
jgi:hypothetical protein